MPRKPRLAPGGWIFHVLNRANGRGKLFETEADYLEFVRLLARCASVDRMRILAWCLMPNHWHFLLWPRNDKDLFHFVHRLTIRHTQHWHIRNDSIGRGHLYQGVFKSSAVQDDRHLLTVCRYIERNPVRAHLVADATEWRWSSARDRIAASGASEMELRKPLLELATMPVDVPPDWTDWLRDPQDLEELERVRTHLATRVPLGDETWTASAASLLGLPAKPRRQGRPRKSDPAVVAGP